MTVSCGGGVSYFRCIKNNSTHSNDDTLYVKTNDIINLKTTANYILRSHDITFTIEDKSFQQVVGHQERIGGNDEVCQVKKNIFIN